MSYSSKISDIRAIRAITDCGLKEAKEIVELVEKHIRQEISYENGDYVIASLQRKINSLEEKRNFLSQKIEIIHNTSKL